MAKYLILIYGVEQKWDAMTESEVADLFAAHRAFSAAAGDSLVLGAQLESSSTATSLRSGPDRSVVPTDGPFLETKEALGGFYLVEAPDLDKVVEMASGLYEVHAGHSGVEIRPLVEQ
ncbi:YciI family protein [Hamadaea tsunoensis]|uniref:YciI family protein n=1 Tax=Hamadaea tsunoensis TaxID=53368 RepID=UPI00040A7472|nr:YciI family protein [Hamadaea tsunoensis]